MFAAWMGVPVVVALMLRLAPSQPSVVVTPLAV
jgi:hypothetical protein